MDGPILVTGGTGTLGRVVGTGCVRRARTPACSAADPGLARVG